MGTVYIPLEGTLRNERHYTGGDPKTNHTAEKLCTETKKTEPQGGGKFAFPPSTIGTMGIKKSECEKKVKKHYKQHFGERAILLKSDSWSYGNAKASGGSKKKKEKRGQVLILLA